MTASHAIASPPLPDARLKGVIAAVATPFTPAGEPDLDRYVAWCAWLLDHGCDGLNLCGTTGEATSM